VEVSLYLLSSIAEGRARKFWLTDLPNEPHLDIIFDGVDFGIVEPGSGFKLVLRSIWLDPYRSFGHTFFAYKLNRAGCVNNSVIFLMHTMLSASLSFISHDRSA